MASLIVIVLAMLAVGGVYAEDIDVDSSVVTESPISADVDTSLSSCDAFNNDLSNIYESSDSSNLYESSDSYDYYGSSDMPQVNEKSSYAQNGTNTIITEVSGDIETSECNELIKNITMAENSVKFVNDNTMLAVSESSIPYVAEPVFDSTLMESEYISQVEEVYFGVLSSKDNDKLLKAVGSVKNLLFANMAYWYNGTLKLEKLLKIVNHEESYEGLFDVNTITKALLKYDPQEIEWWIYKFSDEDEQGHVINDTNSHGLDYAYNKHENVTNKDMLKFVVLTPYGIVFIEEQSSVGIWDGLNDILDGISSKTLLPDHQEKWTPLWLLTQQDSEESSEDSHTDDNEKKNKIDTGDTEDNSNSGKQSDFNSASHNNNWGEGYSLLSTANAVQDGGLDKLDNSTENSTNSTNVTASGNQKQIESPKINQDAEPAYTLIYAILGIVLISFLFNSSYMKRDD